MSRKKRVVSSFLNSFLIGGYNKPGDLTPTQFMSMEEFADQINEDSEVGDYTAEQIINVPAGNIEGTNVQDVLDNLTADEIANVPAGNIVATEVQAAIDELDGQDTANAALKADIAGETFTGPIITDPSDADDAGFNLPAGIDPNVPVAGDVWFDGTNFKARDGNGNVITLGAGFTFKSYPIGNIGTADSVYLAGFFRAPTSDVELTVGGSATQTYGASGDAHAAHAFIVAEDNGSYVYDVTVVGTHGTLVIDIDGTDYTQVFNTSAATTATDWITTHTGALAALNIVPLTGGAGIISLTAEENIVVTDDGVGMSLSGIVQQYSFVVQTEGGSAIFRLDIDGVDYDEAFDTDAATTAAAWVATHTAALGGLSPAITATNPAGARINLAVVGEPVYTDQSIFGMSQSGVTERDIVVAGGAGSLVIDINGVDYTEAFSGNADTTADNWRATHTATLGGLGDPITVTDGGPATITLVVASGLTPTIVDDSSGGMSITYSDEIIVAALIEGTLVVDIDGVDYTEAFDTDADTTADNWRATHTATLGGLNPVLTVTDGGPGRVIITAASGTPVFTDDGVGGMQFIDYASALATLNGDNGDTIIEVDGTDYTESFDTNAADTAAAFVTNQAAAILSAKNVIVTNVGAILYFDHLTVQPTIVDNSTDGFISHSNIPQANGGVITVTGKSIDDAGNYDGNDSEIIVASINAAITDQVFQTDKKWLGQITFTISGESGAAFMFNYGFVKYEDFGGRDFVLNDVEFLMHAGASETGLDVEIFHYNSAEMTYHASSFDPMAQAQYSLLTDHTTEGNDVDDNFDGGWKRAGIGLSVAGSGQEGIIARVTTAVTNSISYGVLHLGVSV